MSPNGPFNRAVSNDLPVRDVSRIKQVRARRPSLRAFEEALVLEGAVHLVPDLVRRRLSSDLVDFVDQLSADLRRCVVLQVAHHRKLKPARRSPVE